MVFFMTFHRKSLLGLTPYSCSMGQGPSCKTFFQIPDLKVVYVRFILADSEGCSDADTSKARKRKPIDAQSSISTVFRPPPSKARSSPSKILAQSKQPLPTWAKSTYVPRSLSISDMIKLGKINTKTPTTIVEIFGFDMEVLSWS